MTNQRILEKAIRKAIDGGWDAFGSESQSIDVEVVYLVNGELEPDLVVDKPGIYICVHRHHGTYSVPELIFNHDFAKSLWGNKPHWLGFTPPTSAVDGRTGKTVSVSVEVQPVYLWHLQQMVIAEDPIKYLGEHL